MNVAESIQNCARPNRDASLNRLFLTPLVCVYVCVRACVRALKCWHVTHFGCVGFAIICLSLPSGGLSVSSVCLSNPPQENVTGQNK